MGHGMGKMVAWDDGKTEGREKRPPPFCPYRGKDLTQEKAIPEVQPEKL